MQAAAQQLRDVQKQNKALFAELERLQRVKDARISQLDQVWPPRTPKCTLHALQRLKHGECIRPGACGQDAFHKRCEADLSAFSHEAPLSADTHFPKNSHMSVCKTDSALM